MKNGASVTIEGEALVIIIPMRFKRRSGRKQIVAAGGPGSAAVAAAPQEALATAVARAHAWLELMESGRFSSMSALAEYLGYDRKYVARFLDLTLLAPDLIGAILNGEEPSGLSLEKLSTSPIPLLWKEQRSLHLSP